MVSCSFKARQRESQPIYFIFTIGQAIFCLITQKNKSTESPIQWGVEKHPLLISNACPRPGSFHLCVNVIATSTKILITLRKWFSSNMRNNQTTTNASWHTRHAISAGTACLSLQRGLPRQPGPQSHRTDWRNKTTTNITRPQSPPIVQAGHPELDAVCPSQSRPLVTLESRSDLANCSPARMMKNPNIHKCDQS